MRDEVRVAAVQMDVAWMDPAANLGRMADFVEQVQTEGAVDLILFPELANSGYVKGRDREFGRNYFKVAEPVPAPSSRGSARPRPNTTSTWSRDSLRPTPASPAASTTPRC